MTTITNCPSDETLAAFIDGRLEGEARETVLAHVATCSECRDMLNSVHELEALTPSRRSWLVPAATLAAAAAIAAVLYLGPVGDTLRRPDHLKAITAATAGLEERPIEARPSIDIAHKHYPIMRGKEEEPDPSAEILQRTVDLDKALKWNRSAANLHAAGIGYLLAGVPGAVELLEEAQTNMNPPSAELLNDLAAAYHDAKDEKNAKATIEKAWQLKQTPTIAWTRAVILQTREAWEDYLKIDSTSEWAAEARSKLENF